jgi:hypothetical protein
VRLLVAERVHQQRAKPTTVVGLGERVASQLRRGDHATIDGTPRDEVVGVVALVLLREEVRVAGDGVECRGDAVLRPPLV